MPTLTEKPAFWIAFLLFETAVPMLVPNRVWAGFAMLLFGSIFYTSALGWLRLSVFHAALPSAGVFLSAAVVFSLAAAGAVGWYDKSILERDASELSSALLDFSNECRARMFPSLTPAQKLEEEHRQRTRYLDKFAAAIASVHKRFVANGLCHEGLEQTWLGYATTLDTADLAALASQSIADFGRQVPIPRQSWKRKRYIKAASLVFVTMIFIWSSLLVFCG